MAGAVSLAILLFAGGLAVCALIGGLTAMIIKGFSPSLADEKIARLSGVPMPLLAAILVLAVVTSPIGVDDNGPQVMGGIILIMGAIGVAALGFFVGRKAARLVLRRLIAR